jgi:transposase
LRDFPQEIVQTSDPEALRFVTDLIDPCKDHKERARKLLPPPWIELSNSDLFEAVMALASGLLADPNRRGAQGRPRNQDFGQFQPEFLAFAGRAILGGGDGFAALADEYRKNRTARPHRLYGVEKELGPLAAVPRDEFVCPNAREFIGAEIQAYLRNRNLVAKSSRSGSHAHSSGAALEDLEEQGLYTIQRLSKILKTRPEAIARLSRSGLVKVARVSDAHRAPVLMSYAEVAEAAHQYADSILDWSAAGTLGLPRALLPALADLGHLERLTGTVLGMTSGPVAFSRTSIETFRNRLWTKVKSPPPAKAARLRRAATWLGYARPPWLRIVVALLEGRLEAFAHPKRRSNVLKHLFVRDVAALHDAITAGPELLEVEDTERLDICAVAGILRINEAFVSRLVKLRPEVLRKHDESYAPFVTSEVEEVARKYIFVPEISRRSGVGDKNVRHWLFQKKVRPVFSLQQNRQLIFLRQSVERYLPKRANTSNKKLSFGDRISAEVRLRVIKALKNGASVPEVARRENLERGTVHSWAKRWHRDLNIEKKTGGTRSELDEHADWARELVKQRPTITLSELADLFRRTKKVKTSDGNVRYFVKRHKIPVRRAKPHRHFGPLLIAAEYVG